MSMNVSALTRPLLALLAFGFAAVSSLAQSVALPAKESFHVFLLVGQSNMAGRGVVTPEDKIAHPRVLMLNQAGEWMPATDPLHFDKPAAVGVGLGRSFGLAIAEKNPGITIGLIPCAVGGSPIDAWRPGEFYQPTRSHPWDDAMKRARLALQAGTLKGILWHQGESDSNATLAPGYEAKLHDLILRMRAELKAPNVPFVAGQMGQFEDSPWPQFKQQVDQVHRDLPRKVARTAFVGSDGLKHKGDKVHFDAESYREFGRRYAAAYLKLIP
jgi:pimeloyl-ACP methyl ester carboxylesterase